MSPDLIARLLVTAFCAVVFLQSSLDKLTDWRGNLAYFQDHFTGSPFSPAVIPPLLSLLTLIEFAAGSLCALGLLTGGWLERGVSMAACGVAMSGAALLCLLLGQRLAKDYAGAAVIAAYFAVALIGLGFF
jgi:putative oxidoreductase